MRSALADVVIFQAALSLLSKRFVEILGSDPLYLHPPLPSLKLVRCPSSLAPTLVALPSLSLIPFAPFFYCIILTSYFVHAR